MISDGLSIKKEWDGEAGIPTPVNEEIKSEVRSQRHVDDDTFHCIPWQIIQGRSRFRASAGEQFGARKPTLVCAKDGIRLHSWFSFLHGRCKPRSAPASRSAMNRSNVTLRRKRAKPLTALKAWEGLSTRSTILVRLRPLSGTDWSPGQAVEEQFV